MTSEKQTPKPSPVIRRISTDTIAILQNDSTNEVARIIAANWNCAAHKVHKRPIIATAIRCQGGKVIGLVIQIAGSPPRGVVTVMLVGRSNVAAIDDRKKKLRKSQISILKGFAREFIQLAWPKQVES